MGSYYIIMPCGIQQQIQQQAHAGVLSVLLVMIYCFANMNEVMTANVLEF
jgi:hypothetical protein